MAIDTQLVRDQTYFVIEAGDAIGPGTTSRSALPITSAYPSMGCGSGKGSDMPKPGISAAITRRSSASRGITGSKICPEFGT